MLQQICEEIHNFFIRDRREGTYTVAGGMIQPFDFAKDGQRFWVCGSDLNDGVYTYHAGEIHNDDDTEIVSLNPETFYGTIFTMAVPRGVLELAQEITGWQEKYADVMNSPYQSESFNGYSYTKASGSGNGGSDPGTWQGKYAKRLNAWRKVAL